MSSSGVEQFRLTFELSPIILTNGIAANMPGGGMPIISLLDPGGSPRSAGGPEIPFANFIPLPGATLIDQDVGTYPFANQAVAANAVITKPLIVSFRMVCPVKTPGGYARKLSVISALQATLAKHNASGGTYVLATPSLYYTNCLMLGMRDVSEGVGESAQAQTDWQLDFLKPLLTLQDAQQAQNALMTKISSGTRVDDPAWSGPQPTVGNPDSLAQPSVVQPAQGVGGAGITGRGPG